MHSWASSSGMWCPSVGASSLLMRAMYQALTVGLDFPGDQTPNPETAAAAAIPSGPATAAGWRPQPDLALIHGGVPGASGPLGRCALVYTDDCLIHSPTLEQHQGCL